MPQFTAITLAPRYLQTGRTVDLSGDKKQNQGMCLVSKELF